MSEGAEEHLQMAEQQINKKQVWATQTVLHPERALRLLGLSS